MQTTPKRREYNASGNAEQFSPVIIAESPVSRASGTRNLTGNPRIVRDLVANIHAAIQRWNAIHLHGISVLKAITQVKVNEKYPEGLQDLCDDLEKDCDALAEVVLSLRQFERQAKAVASLQKSTDVLFLTWPVEKFGHAAEMICQAYSDELEIRYKILENVAHNHLESWKMSHMMMWVHQTRVPDHLTTLLESMLVETGHR